VAAILANPPWTIYAVDSSNKVTPFSQLAFKSTGMNFPTLAKP
jgi:hypothetical protein